VSAIVIRAEGLSKRYQVAVTRGPSGRLTESLQTALQAPLRRLRANGKGPPRSRELWALKDVSFEVAEGEVVGIIGRNGAGKTTLLKILSQITEPTEGYADLHGRVGSLLEVGAGFHPELTGRENIFLNGAVLGMGRAEIVRKFDEIVDFAGVQEFIDVPVKRYSSGMYVRLAFAVAAHLEPEILIVDEVLAVGDADFQKKSLGKMSAVAGEGRTVLFVSHNMQAISTLTERTLVLDAGRCVADGPTDQMVTRYLEVGASRERVYEALPSPTEPRVTRVEIVTSHPDNVQLVGQPMQVRLEVTSPGAINGAAVSIQICDAHGEPVVYLWRFDSDEPLLREPGRYELTCSIPKLRLFLGHYSLTVHFAEQGKGRKLETIERICPFEVTMYGTAHHYGWSRTQCRYLEDAEWLVEKTNGQAPGPLVAAEDRRR